MPRGWSVITRRDGARMWAYRGHPVYTFFKDRKPGDAFGQGVADQWGSWRIASASGGYANGGYAAYAPRMKGHAGYGGGSGSSGMGGSSGGGY